MLFDRSPVAGLYPAESKRAFIAPIDKKGGLDINDVGSISTYLKPVRMSEMFERVVTRQLMAFVERNNLLQSI